MSPASADTTRYKVPAGFRQLLEALAREVLRAQPDDIYAFSTLFFNQLQKHRKANPNVDNLLEDSIAYDRFRIELHETAKQLGYEHCRGEEVQRAVSPMDDAAKKIQAAFRGHLVRAHPELFGVPNGSVVQKPTRRHSNERLNMSDTKKGVKRHSVGYLGAFDTPEDRAATKIQAEIRGFLTRRKVSAMKRQSDVAATKIQSHIRGYLTRKHLDEKGMLHSRSHSSLRSSKSDDDLLLTSDEAATRIQAQIKG
jgi:hypothetical protein